MLQCGVSRDLTQSARRPTQGGHAEDSPALPFVMRSLLRSGAVLVLAACAGNPTGSPRPVALKLPDSTVILDPATGATIPPAMLLRRIAAAEVVLLGELHDNALHHQIRGSLIAALGDRHPAVVFEQFAATDQPIPSPAPDQPRDAWLDQHGFDRQGWKWPLHQPVVEAALRHGRAIWGSGISREALRAVVRDGEGAAPEGLQSMLRSAPLDEAARAAMDQELIDGHCGKLPVAMIPGMRTAQSARDAAMARALQLASRTGPAWLIAGNGHVRKDTAVPRLLRVVLPGRTVLVVGLLEWSPGGGALDAGARDRYDLVIGTPRTPRSDPCAGI